MERCPNCGASIRTGARFCTACGNRISQPAPTPGPVDAPPAPVVTGAPVWSTAPADAQADQPSSDGEAIPEADALSGPSGAAQSAAASATADGWRGAGALSEQRAPDHAVPLELETPAPSASAPEPTTRTDASSAPPERDDRYSWSTWSPARDDAPAPVASALDPESRPVEDRGDTSWSVAEETSEPRHGDDDRIEEVVESQPSTPTAVGSEGSSADAASPTSGASTERDDEGPDVIALPGPDAEAAPAAAAAHAADEPIPSIADDVSDEVYPDPGSATTTDEVVRSGAIEDEPVGLPPLDPVLEDVVLDEAVIRSDSQRAAPAAWTTASPAEPSESAQAHDAVWGAEAGPDVVSTARDADDAPDSVPVAGAEDQGAVSAIDPDGAGPGADDDWEPWGHADQADPTPVISADGDAGTAASDCSAGLWSVDGPAAAVETPAVSGIGQPPDDPLGEVRRLVEELRAALAVASVADPGRGVSAGAGADEVLQLLGGMPVDPVNLREVEELRDEADELEGRDFDIRALQRFAQRRMLIGDLVTAYLQQRDLLEQLRATVTPPDSPAPSN